MRLALDYFVGEMPASLTITDHSAKLLNIAQKSSFIPDATYLQLDVRSDYPFDGNSFDLILATMVFNEVSTPGLKRALRPCKRVLRPNGTLLITVTHPQFIQHLDRQKQLKTDGNRNLTMPGANNLRYPIIPRQIQDYEKAFTQKGLDFEATEIFANEAVFKDKPTLRKLGKRPLALLWECRHTHQNFC